MGNIYTTALLWGFGFLLSGVLLCAVGEIGWILGVVFIAVGIGSIAAGFTECGDSYRTPHSVNLAVRKAEDIGAAERSAISAAVCAGMADGSFYRDPKRVVASARRGRG